MQVVSIRKQKRPDGRGTWGAYDLGADDFGTWLFTPQGSLYRGEKDGEVGYCNVGSPTGPGAAVMHLVPHQGWWITTFWDPSASLAWSVTIDVSTPPTFADGMWSYIDLELDAFVDAASGEALVEDQDEFDEACAAGHIPPDEALAARKATDDVVSKLRVGEEPFASVGHQRLEETKLLELLPLRTVPDESRNR